MRSCMTLLLAGLLGSLLATPCRAGDAKDYLTADGKLKDKLTLTIVHHADNAGRTTSTRTWVIEPSGEWAQTMQGVNFGARAPRPRLVAKGKLTPPQLAALAQHLATQDMNKLTESLGIHPAPARPYCSTTIGFGKKSTTLNTDGESLTEGLPKAGDPKADDWSRFVAVTLVVQNLLQDTKAEPKKAKDKVIREIGLRSPTGPYNTGATRPTTISSAKELAKAFPDQEHVATEVDFAKEQCLFFAWKGSSGDRLSYKIVEDKKGPVVVFSYSPGRTEDLRRHFRCYAIARNATWRFDDKR